jgi:hypothetical protein
MRDGDAPCFPSPVPYSIQFLITEKIISAIAPLISIFMADAISPNRNLSQGTTANNLSGSVPAAPGNFADAFDIWSEKVMFLSLI